MKILVLNSGSSSLKYQLWETENHELLATGLVSRIGIENPLLEHKAHGKKFEIRPNETIDHRAGVEISLAALTNPEYGVISHVEEIEAVGHRVVHGGEKFSGSALITDDVLTAIEDCISIAPLHNPPNLMGINACKVVLHNVPQVAVFDTAFHQTMEPQAFLYALPYELYEKHRIRRYGFHGTSHGFVASKAAELLGKDITDLKIITAHLGNGASITAVKNGKSVDTSMGFTPLEGLVMGTRTGDMDPAIIFYVMKLLGLSIDQANDFFNKKCGMTGMTKLSNDMRDIHAAIAKGDNLAKQALEIYCYRIKKYIGAYAAAMGGVDALVFTAGIGENDPDVRSMATADLGFLGIEIDETKNADAFRKTLDISKEGAKVHTLVIQTNEELVISLETERIVKKD